MLFSHDARARGRFSIDTSGRSIQSGTVVAGFIVGCGVSAAGGIQVGISPSQGLAAGFSPTITLTTPPTVSVSPSVGATVGSSQSGSIILEPGQVTAVIAANVPLGATSRFPYRMAFDQAAINVSQCITPGSAVPYVTASITTDSVTVQTTAYGDQFMF
jgi:hypothetical protein